MSSVENGQVAAEFLGRGGAPRLGFLRINRKSHPTRFQSAVKGFPSFHWVKDPKTLESARYRVKQLLLWLVHTLSSGGIHILARPNVHVQLRHTRGKLALTRYMRSRRPHFLLPTPSLAPVGVSASKSRRFDACSDRCSTFWLNHFRVTSTLLHRGTSR